MKGWLILSIFTLFAAVLTACQDKPAGPEENTMMLRFKNNADFTFHSIRISTRDISGGTQNADGSPIEKGKYCVKNI
ncbi:hypothetical protein [Salibacterium halotolerans]|uniref:Lipoprotein n=1 Tax=Salibacterium halotolerans TaxID=1884432 RepID=A0A1I5S4Z5_9BACI|nr:hypothetical protein [Salibacterium halotolerans]SFP65835.1 hypothetical protein SAMN05518683_10852 [Salibacterium halotolerans]